MDSLQTMLVQLQISAENVGGQNFTWRIEYFGNEEKNVFMEPGDRSNHECLCVPMDMYVDYQVSDISVYAGGNFVLMDVKLSTQ